MLVRLQGKAEGERGCHAKLHPHFLSSSVALKDGEKWRRRTCTTLSLNAACPECRKLHKLFLQRAKKCHDRKSRAKTFSIKSLCRKAILATLRREKVSQELAAMKKQHRNTTEESIDTVFRILPIKKQLTFKTALMAAMGSCLRSG